MRIRPQSELANVQHKALALNQTEAVTQSRFDAALLQAAQSVRDSEQGVFAGLSPKMRMALSSIMEQLGQKTSAELQALARQPQALASLTSVLEQSGALSPAEAAQLGKLLLQALPRLLALKTGVEAPSVLSDTAPKAAAGAGQRLSLEKTPAQAGPSAEFFQILAAQAGLSAGPGPAVLPLAGQAGTQSKPSEALDFASLSPMFSAAAALPAPLVRGGALAGSDVVPADLPAGSVSGVRTIPVAVNTPVSGVPALPVSAGAEFRASGFSGLSVPVNVRELSVGGPVPALEVGAAFPVSGGGNQVFDPAAMLSPAPSGAARILDVVASPGSRLQGNQTQAVIPQAQSGSPAVPASGPLASNPQASNALSGAGEGVSSPTVDTGFPVLLDMNVQVADSAAPLSVQANTQVTLKGDGSWIFPQGAPVQSPKAPPPPQASQPPVQPAVPASTLGVVQAPLGSVPEAVLSAGPVLRTDGGQNPLEGQVQENAAGLSQVSGGEGKFLEALALQDAVQPGGGDQVATGVGTQAQALAEGQFQGQQGVGASQTQASQLLLGQLPVVTQSVGNGSGSNGTQGQGSAAPSATGGGGTSAGLVGGLKAQGASPALPTLPNAQNAPVAGPAGQESFAAALAGVNQNSGQAFAGAQALAPNSLSAGLVQAVNAAIDNAGSVSPGRLLIQLSPANLGDVQVDLSMVGGKLTARLVTSQQDVRDALVRDLSGFKAGLESHGVVVNEVSVAVRAGVDNGQQQADGRAPQQNAWRSLPPNPSRESVVTAAAGLSAYGENAAGVKQGFSALA